MFLQALTALYDRLAADPDSGIAAYGYSRQQIAFVVVLNSDGTLHAIEDGRREDAKGKLKPQRMVVIGNAKPPGSGINPCFLWDNAAYALGYKADDPKPERTREAFEAFRERHLSVASEIDDSEFAAVGAFLKSWDPAEAEKHTKLQDVGPGFGVFQIRNTTHYVHERPVVKAWWETQLVKAEANDSDTIGQCLITGEVGPLARLHEPKIKGVYGGQSAGAALVSFNLDAFDSYGKSQSVNAPVAELAAFKYCTALNYLLDPSRKRRMSIGDTSVVYWTEKPTEAEDWFADFCNPSLSAEDEAGTRKLSDLLAAIAKGKRVDHLGPPETKFYVLGLSPNAARISVRFWYESTVGEMQDNIGRHYADLNIAHGPKDLPHPPLWRLLRETVRDAKDILDLLEGAMLRAIITGSDYPQLFFSSLIRRTRADREMRHVRAAAIKAFLNRNLSLGLPMALDPQRTDDAYRLGRLFAELEKCQEDALPGINDTIKDRYFSAASATPGSVFPRLIRLNQHHLGKLERGARAYREKRIQEIAAGLDGFRMHLPMQDQGLFAIGYYHQRQDIFTKKSKAADASADAKTEQ